MRQPTRDVAPEEAGKPAGKPAGKLAGEPAGKPAGKPLRGNRTFLLLWTGAGVSVLGVRVSAIAYPLLVLWQTGSATAAGLVGFAAQLPQLLVQLPVGVLVDRVNRRRLMIGVDIAGCLAVGSLVAALAAGHLWLPHVMAVAFIEGSGTIAYRLAERAAVRNVVPVEHLPAAMSRNEARGQAAGLLGQPVGTMLFTATRALPFAFTAVTHAVALVLLLLIKQEFQTARQPVRRRLRTEIAEGIAWVWRQRFLRAAAGIIAGTNVLFQIMALALLVIMHRQHRPAIAIGLILTAAGIGGMIGALTADRWMRRLSLYALAVGATASWAVLMPAVALVHGPVALGLIFAGMAYVGGVLNVAASVYQVRITPDELQGRVASVSTLLASGANSLGVLSAGILLDHLGVGHTVLGAGAVMVALAVLAATSPAVRAEGRTASGTIEEI
ncbi:MAG TPA: MFS transporter [Mycobacteriales bacterium]|nr:MFS transporter [Mycobacteriales bacterium]